MPCRRKIHFEKGKFNAPKAIRHFIMQKVEFIKWDVSEVHELHSSMN